MNKISYCTSLSLLALALVSCSSTSTKKSSEASTSATIEKPKIQKKAQGELEFKNILEPYPGLKIHEYVQSYNNLRVLLIPRKQNDTVGVVVAYSVGSRHEEINKTGLAHLFEHMMFRGTESFPEPFKTLAQWGNQFNAFTSLDQTVYHEMIPSSVLENALKFESERMRKLLITPQVFNTERGAVVSERKLNFEDSPGGRLYWEMHQNAFDKHPYKTLPIGWQDDIEKASFEDALSFYHRYYAPNRAGLILVGDFDIDKAKDLIQKYYGRFEPVLYPDPKTPKETMNKKLVKKTIGLKTQAAMIGDGILSPPQSDIDNAAAEAFYCVLLADSSSGYLNHALVEKGLARNVSSSCFPDVDTGLSMVRLGAIPGTKAAVLEKRYLDARKGFLTWLNTSRFENIKKYFETFQLESLRDPMDLASTLGSNLATAGDPLFTFKFFEKIKGLTLKDIEKRHAAWESTSRTRILIEASDKNDPMKKQ